MADQYTWGLIFGLVLGLVALYNLGLFTLYNFVMKTRTDSSDTRSDCLTSNSVVNQECESDHFADTDVIIVGAGVAGAALAHTLGKVTNNFFCSLRSFFFFFGEFLRSFSHQPNGEFFF